MARILEADGICLVALWAIQFRPGAVGAAPLLQASQPIRRHGGRHLATQTPKARGNEIHDKWLEQHRVRPGLDCPEIVITFNRIKKNFAPSRARRILD